MKKLKTYSIYLVIGLVGITLGAIFFGNSAPATQSIDEHLTETHTDEEGNIVYSCSMHPSVRQNEPGNCPICGMNLIPVNDNNSESEDPDAITMSFAALKLAEIETTEVRTSNAPIEVRLPGKVVIDEREIVQIPAHFHGRIEQLFVNFTGEYITKGAKVARVYSPELFTAQKELFEAYTAKDSNPTLYQAARKKLMNWKIPPAQIDEILANGTPDSNIDIHAHKSGYVLKRFVSVGDHLVRGDLMYEVSELSSIWVQFDAYESDLGSISKGDEITFTIPSLPGRTFTSKIDFIDPILDNSSRTVRIRTNIQNKDLNLKPGMLAEGIVRGNKSSTPALLVPKSAVMWTGTRSIVYVEVMESDKPTFKAREVTLGKRIGDYYEILDGLEAGETVVKNGTFKIDSAAQLADKLSMMNRIPGTGANRTGHEGHIMTDEMKADVVSKSAFKGKGNSRKLDAKFVPVEFKQQLTGVVDAYLELKDALNQTNPEAAMRAAKLINTKLTAVDMSLVQGDLHIQWMAQLGSLNNNSTAIAAEKNIEMQRTIFLSLSKTLIESVKIFGINGVVYQQFCPMTNGGKGGYWLSDTEEIANPYFGDKMNNCGETILKIES